MTVDFPTVGAPVVSVVLVTYGGFDFVLPALQALADNTDPCYEVIVVDNASPDGTGPRLRDAVSGATVVLNDVNVGFGAGANQGALLAKGRHVFFLNSDAFVQPGWLPPLLAVLDGDSEVGAVVARLIDPDGTVQEAGGLVGAFAHAGPYGKGGDAAALEYRFRRQVDFGSGAALLVRRSAFLAVGGFHPAFVLGYFEDVDLCLDLARHGLRTVYEPTSVVSHLIGASTQPGESARRGAASHAVYAERWGAELERRPALVDLDLYPHRLVAARDFVATDRILVVTGPTPDAEVVAFANQLVELWPWARITLLGGGGVDGHLDPRIERAAATDVDEWFAARRFHYSTVMLDGAAGGDAVEGAIRRTQPQAARIQLARFTSGPVDVEMAATRTADAVICLSLRAYDLVCTWAGRCRGPVVAEPTPGAIVDLLAGLGVAPPPARV